MLGNPSKFGSSPGIFGEKKHFQVSLKLFGFRGRVHLKHRTTHRVNLPFLKGNQWLILNKPMIIRKTYFWAKGIPDQGVAGPSVDRPPCLPGFFLGSFGEPEVRQVGWQGVKADGGSGVQRCVQYIE